MGIYGPITTDECGRATLPLEVSMQTGDNYRAAASLIQEAMIQDTLYIGQPVTPQQHADALSAHLSATGKWLKKGNYFGYSCPRHWSPMLTVWRKLHVETDSMVRPNFAQNTYNMVWTSPSDGGAPDRVQVQVNDSVSFDTGDGQSEGGWIRLSDGTDFVYGRVLEYHSTIGWDEVIVIISSTNGLGGQQGLAGLGGMMNGSAILGDDDIDDESVFKAGVWGCDDGYAGGLALLPPDLDALDLRYKPAYIFPVHAIDVSGIGGVSTFLRNVAFGFFGDYGKILWDQANLVRGLPISTREFWSVLVISAWQAETGKDSDPNGETITNGISSHDDGESASSIGAQYTGLCTIFKAQMEGESDIAERYTVAHEIAHTLGVPHASSGLMFAAESVGAPAEQSEPFSANSLVKLREYDGP